MTAPTFIGRSALYALFMVAAVALGVFAPWSAVLAWSVAVIVDATLSGLLWLFERRYRN